MGEPILAVGSLVAAMASTLAPFLTGRALQGVAMMERAIEETAAILLRIREHFDTLDLSGLEEIERRGR